MKTIKLNLGHLIFDNILSVKYKYFLFLNLTGLNLRKSRLIINETIQKVFMFIKFSDREILNISVKTLIIKP